MTRLDIRTMNKKRLAAVLLCTAVCAGHQKKMAKGIADGTHPVDRV